MKTRVVILAGGEGSRLSVLTAKRAKPAVPFAGKYRIIDFPLSNCANSRLFDVLILAQYRPQSLIEHIGAGGPWDLNRDFTGGVRIYTPYKARFESDWFVGTADAVQQNFTFIKRDQPELVLILSGDHIYSMDYDALITFHLDQRAELTMAAKRVPQAEASRFGIVGVDGSYRVEQFVEKPSAPPSNLANMGIYVFNLKTLNEVLWADHANPKSSHDFGKDIIPAMIRGGRRVFAFPYSGYWVDVGTISSYWQAHMDLLDDPPPLDLNDRRWVIHTRTEERPPARIQRGAVVEDSLISDGCLIEPGALVQHSILSPGTVVRANAVVRRSILLTDTHLGEGSIAEDAILDKHAFAAEGVRIGALSDRHGPRLTLVGKNSYLPAGIVLEPGAVVSTDVVAADFDEMLVKSGVIIYTKRKPYEI